MQKCLETRAVEVFFHDTTFGAREEELERHLVSAAGEVGEFGNREVVGVGQTDHFVLQTEHKDDCIGVTEALTVPDTHYERVVVDVETVVQLMEFHLVLVDDVRADGNVAEGAAFAAAALEVEVAADMGGPLDGQTAHGDEAFVRAGDVVDRQTEVEVLGIANKTGGEVGHTLRLFLRGSFVRFIHKTVLGINHIAKSEAVPVQTFLLVSRLQCKPHIEFSGNLQLV